MQSGDGSLSDLVVVLHTLYMYCTLEKEPVICLSLLCSNPETSHKTKTCQRPFQSDQTTWQRTQKLDPHQLKPLYPTPVPGTSHSTFPSS